MAIPISTTWDLADFDATTIEQLLGLGGGDMTADPSVFPYFEYSDTPNRTVRALGGDGIEASLSLLVAVPQIFTAEAVLRFDSLPNSTGDLERERVGIVVADDGGRGLAIYFARTGLAISRIGDFRSVTALPDTTHITREATEGYKTIRVGVDSTLGRAYIYVGDGITSSPQLRFIVPVAATPGGTTDTFKIFVMGQAAHPTSYRLRGLRLASGLVATDAPPTAVAGLDRVIPLGGNARLDGRGSYDAEGSPLTYDWQVSSVPFGSQYAADITSGRTNPDFGVDGYTSLLEFEPDALPEWVAEGDTVQLAEALHRIATVDNSSGFLVVDGDTLPDNLDSPFRILRQSILVGADTSTPYIVPDVQGVYRFSLVVNDGSSDSEASEVLVNVVGARAPLGTEPDVSALWDMLGDEWRFIKDRGIYEEAWRGVAQLMGGLLLEVWQYHYNYSLKDAQGVFQRRWMHFVTTVYEPKPDSVEVRLVPGHIATTPLYLFGPELAFESLRPVSLEIYGVGVFDYATVDALSTALSNGDLDAYGVFFVTALDAELNIIVYIGSTQGPVRVTEDSVTDLFPNKGEWGHLHGVRGRRLTENTYMVDDELDLSVYGVAAGDYLVLNGGQSFRIERLLSAETEDGVPWRRILLSDPLPLDASPEWAIPSTIKGTEDYYRRGVYPGDSVLGEVYDSAAETVTSVRGKVQGVVGDLVLADVEPSWFMAPDLGQEMRFVGVKRRKALEVPDGTRSIPRLQDTIPVNSSPVIWQENVDYIIEPFYRETDGSALPMLQFHDATFIEPDVDPPDILWAELVVLSNAENIENTFGRLAGLSLSQAAALGPDFNYLAGVSGLLYAQRRGPNVSSMRGGAQILLGQPFAEVSGRILEVAPNFSPAKGRMLVQDADGFDPPRSEIVRTYLYRKDPLDLSDTSGLDLNPTTGLPWAAGDDIQQFTPIGAGVRILDMYNEPEWYYPLVRSGGMSELQKFHTFAVKFNLDLTTTASLDILARFIERTKPHYTKPIIMGSRDHQEDIDLLDAIEAEFTLSLHDIPSGSGPSYYYDEVRGDGTYWNFYDVGPFLHDERIDVPIDIIDVMFTLHWPGGVITLTDCPYGGTLFFATTVVDVDGTLGPPGGTFVPTDLMVLPAGDYQFVSPIKDSGVLP